jgi:hypothetical protein
MTEEVIIKAKPKMQKGEDQKKIDQMDQNFQEYSENLKQMSLDRANSGAKKEDSEPQTQLSQKEIEKTNDIYLKPRRTFPPKEKFNEEFRDDYNFRKEYVQFIAENKEIVGESMEFWTKPFPGVAAEEWEIPPNRPVWGPRYLAERVKKCAYHRFTMKDNVTQHSGMGSFYGQMAVDTLVQRLDAVPVSTRKSIFMGASGF